MLVHDKVRYQIHVVPGSLFESTFLIYKFSISLIAHKITTVYRWRALHRLVVYHMVHDARLTKDWTRGLEYCDLDILFIVLQYIDSNRVLINIIAKRIQSHVKYNWVFLNTIFFFVSFTGQTLRTVPPQSYSCTKATKFGRY